MLLQEYYRVSLMTEVTGKVTLCDEDYGLLS